MKKTEEDKVQKINDEADRIRKEKEELDKKIEEVKSSKFRKMSDLPAEPTDDSNAITLAFRLPNGSRLTRKFLKTDKVQVVFYKLQYAYDYIYTQKNIGLENEFSEIEILVSYPPKPLDNFNQTFEVLFGDSQQELLLIKEKN